jgi:hypothetical protein
MPVAVTPVNPVTAIVAELQFVIDAKVPVPPVGQAVLQAA